MFNTSKATDERWMYLALEQAKQAESEGEVPVGAVVVINEKIIGEGRNQSLGFHDPSAHAEIMAITSASNFLNSKYLKECSLYVTLEPCTMCAGAIYWSQINQLGLGTHHGKTQIPALLHQPLAAPER